jgi:Ca2+-transporting ATPase
VPVIIGITIILTSLLLFVPAFSAFFLFDAVTLTQLGIAVLVGFVSVMWIEIYKVFRRRK